MSAIHELQTRLADAMTRYNAIREAVAEAEERSADLNQQRNNAYREAYGMYEALRIMGDTKSEATFNEWRKTLDDLYAPRGEKLALDSLCSRLVEAALAVERKVQSEVRVSHA